MSTRLVRLVVGTLAVLVVLSAARAQAPSETSPPEPATVATATAESAARTAQPRLAPSDSIPPAELEAYLDGVVGLAMDQAHIAGVTLSVVQDGRLVLEKGYGFASFDPARRVDPATTLFRVGSISKTFTWIEVMRAVEAGKLTLDTPVNEHLPPSLQIPMEGFARPIRLRDLLTHSPGFEDRVLGVLFARDAARVLPFDEFLARYRPRRVREPGEVSSYSNYGAALAGRIVAEIEGLPWQDLIERDIIRPLGLTHVTGREPYPARAGLPAPLSDDLARDLSLPFRWNGSAHDARTFEYITQIAPAGAVSASARDMARYMLLQLGDGTLDGVTVFGPEAARAFRTPLTRLPPELGALDAGFFESVLPGGFHGYGHNGGTLSFFSNMTVVPSLRLGIFVATNTEGGAQLSDPLPSRVVERFYASGREPPSSPPESFDRAAAARLYAGNYLSTRRRYEGLEGFVMRLQGVVSVGVSRYLDVGGANGPAQRFVPTGRPDEFRNANGARGGLDAIRFERAGDRATRIALIPVAFERVSLAYERSTLYALGGLVLLTCIGVVLGAFSRLAHKPAASRGQRAAGRAQLLTALLWLALFGGASALALSTADITKVVYDWPVGGILVVSWAGLLASGATLFGALLLPAVWRGAIQGPREVSGWSPWRKTRYTLALLLFAAFAILLGMWGALEPWSY